MREAILALTMLCLIMTLTSVGASEPFGDGIHPVAVFHSPKSVGTYLETSIDISMDYYLPKDSNQISSFSYSLDGDDNVTLGFTLKTAEPPYFSNYFDYSIVGRLTDLTNAQHRLWIYAYFFNGTAKVIHNGQPFNVDTNFVEPQLIVYSPQNQSSYTKDVPLIYNTNSKILWAYYSLDPPSEPTNDFTPFSGNITFSGLSEGFHVLLISVKTEANTKSTQANCFERINFYVEATQVTTTQPTVNPSPTPTVPEFPFEIVVIALMCASIVILGYKRKDPGKMQFEGIDRTVLPCLM